MSTEKPSSIWPEWEIKEQIGEGSFGKVYRAERTEHGITLESAIKVLSVPQSKAEHSSLRSEGMDETGARIYFEGIVDDCINEIKLMASMKGTSNIVSVEDYQVVEHKDEVGWDIYIRMELLGSFVDYLSDRRLEETEVIKLGIDICSALELCAKKNIIHRDIKPENIFISTFGDFKVGDFGIARELEKTAGALSSKGTYNYMAPEVAAAKSYDATVDTYSLGLVLYRLLNNNRMPFTDPEAEIITYQQRKDAIDRRLKGEPLPLPAKASMPMAQVIIKACAFNPQLRFRSASEMKAALLAVKGGSYVPHVMSLGISPQDDTQPTYDLDATTAVRPAPQAQDYTAAPVIAPQTQTFGEEKRKSRSTMVIALVAALCAFVVIGVGVALYVFHPWDQGDGQVTQDGALVSSQGGTDAADNGGGKQADETAVNDYYLALLGGKVAIYQGSPGGDAKLYRATDIESSDLKAETVRTLESGVAVTDLDAAETLLDSYRKEIETNTNSGVSGGNSVQNQGYQNNPGYYRNARFGYSLDVPRSFVFSEESTNGDGLSMVSDELQMTIVVYGTNNVGKESTKKRYEAALKGNDGWYNACFDKSFVVTYLRNGNVHYDMEYVGAGSINHISLVYPESTKKTNDPILTDIVHSFEAGNLKVAH